MKFRHEYKHEINALDVIKLRQRLRTFCETDPYATSDGTYFIKSLYFDNYWDKALKEKCDGVDKREKFRIRFYNEDISFIRLEKKSKIHGLCLKQSAPITSEQCENLLHGDTAFLKEGENELFHELYAKMQYQLLRPKTVVAYNRECFVFAPGNVRITLDSRIRGSDHILSFLTPGQVLTELYRKTILEVKWDEYLPDIVRDAVGLGTRHTSSFSKYAAVRF